MLYISPWVGGEPTTLVVIGTMRPRRPLVYNEDITKTNLLDPHKHHNMMYESGSQYLIQYVDDYQHGSKW